MESQYDARAEAGETPAITEAIYHANRQDWQRGGEEWVATFDRALRHSRYGLCRTLLEVRTDRDLPRYFSLGRVSQSEGDYYSTLARYDEAEREYTEAISAYDAALRLAPDDVYAHNNRG